MDDDTKFGQRPLTGKREIFAQAIAAQSLNLSDAYRASHNASNMKPAVVNARASELAKVPAVADRITYLQGEATRAAVAKISYTLADAMTQADDAYAAAQSFEQAGAMVSAATLKAKLGGFLIERKEVRTGGQLDDLAVKELLELKAELETRRAREEAADKLAGGGPAPAAHQQDGNRPTRRTLQ